jgi:membrane-associated phospholipid phosphatase
MTWQLFLSSKKNRTELIITIILLAIVLFSLTRFLNYVESRNGFSFDDPILELFNPIDLTWFIFILIYGSLLTAIVYLFPNAEKLLFAVQLYTIMVIVRIIAMWLMPLNPPDQMIMLVDPFVEFFGTGKTLTKDLFFSGHTATLFILFLSTDNRILKTVFLASTIGVAVSVLLQHVHYSIDVFAALFFTYTCFHILNYLKNYIRK